MVLRTSDPDCGWDILSTLILESRTATQTGPSPIGEGPVLSEKVCGPPHAPLPSPTHRSSGRWRGTVGAGLYGRERWLSTWVCGDQHSHKSSADSLVGSSRSGGDAARKTAGRR
jgi:hypothetical protein